MSAAAIVAIVAALPAVALLWCHERDSEIMVVPLKRLRAAASASGVPE